jgi:hypothetical protein
MDLRDENAELLATCRQLEIDLEAGKIQWAAIKLNADKACAENARLREALREIADHGSGWEANRAREALAAERSEG